MSEEKDKPADPRAFDERPLARLLEAAFVLQEHNRELQQVELSLERKREEREQREHDSAVSVPEATVAARQRPDPTPTIPKEAMPAAAAPAGKNDFSTLAQIVEVQHQIQSRHLELEKAMALVAERMVEIGKAGGAAVGTFDGKKVRYRAAVGGMTLPVGTEVSTEKALSSACLRAGEIICCSDVNPEFLLDAAECRRRGIAALIAVPVYHDGRVAGVLELYYATPQTLTDEESHTCQLMAGLITESLARDEEVTWKQSLASERAVMMDALEKLKPNLAAIVDSPAVREPGKPTPASTTPLTPQSAPPAAVFLCRKCGHQFLPGEQFCGSCGSPRSSDCEPPSMQSKVASLWQMQEAMRKSGPSLSPTTEQEHATSIARSSEKSVTESIEEAMPEFFSSTPRAFDGKADHETGDAKFLESLVAQHGGEFANENAKGEITIRFPDAAEYEDELEDVRLPKSERGDRESEDSPTGTEVVKPAHVNWGSASSARTFLEQLKSVNDPGGLARFWRARRGDIYLAIAVILVAIVIRWGIWSNHSVSATASTPSVAHGKPGDTPALASGGGGSDPSPSVSVYDRILIGLGLAEPPPAPEHKGNPETKVWVDLHTALYYCPGADLYGKTPKGKFTSQKDAQLDQFEPAYRKACD